MPCAFNCNPINPGENRFYIGSVGYLALTHSFHPPFKTKMLVNPLFIIFRAKLTLVCSLGHAQ